MLELWNSSLMAGGPENKMKDVVWMKDTHMRRLPPGSVVTLTNLKKAEKRVVEPYVTRNRLVNATHRRL